MEIIELIDNYLERKEDKDREDGKFHVSELGAGIKAMYEKYTGPKREKPKAQLKRIFDNGHFVHFRYYKYFMEMGILRSIEIKAIDDDVFSGTADCIISGKDGVPWVVDIKSCNSWVFNKLEEMKYQHKIQILCYMYFLKLNNGMVLYENKDTQTIKVYKIYMDEENTILIEDLVKQFRELKVKLDTGTKIEFEEEPIETVDVDLMKDVKIGDLIYGTY